MMMKGEESMRLFDVLDHTDENYSFEHLKKGRIESFATKEIERSSNLLACMLLENGLQKNDRVLSLVKDSPIWNIVELGVLKAGGVHVPLSTTVGKEKLTRVFSLVRPSFCVVASSAAEKLLYSTISATKNAAVIRLGENCLTGDMNEHQQMLLESAKNAVQAEDTAVILFTSGSTSHPKGVLLSHRNILLAASEFGQSDVFQGVGRTLSILPMSHSAARKVNYACQLQGITVCYAAPSLSLLHNLRRFQSEHVALVPFLLEQLRQQIEKNIEMPLVLQKISCGGASLSASLWKWFNNREFHVYEVYGLTETASLLSYSTDTCRRPNCVGVLAKNIETRIALNGELEVRGPTVLKTYLMEDGSLKRAVDEDGWFRTGDVVVSREDGGLKIHGRLKRSYKTQRGNYIYPEQVERVLSSIPGVIHAQMVNEPSDPIAVVLVTRSESDTEMIQQTIHNHNQTANEDLKIIKVAFLTSEFKRESTSVEMFKPNKQFINSYLSQIEFQTI